MNTGRFEASRQCAALAAVIVVLAGCSASGGGESALDRSTGGALPSTQTPVPPSAGPSAPGTGAAPPTDGPVFDVGANPGVNPGSFNVPTCPEGVTTSISGTVFDPAGRNPLFNAVVYVPSETLDPVPEGVSCELCNGTASGRPIAAALTDTLGNFVMTDAPAGDVPLVIQVGKWRRQVTLNGIQPCVNNAIQDPNLTRLPRNQSEGHLPRIALTTGHSDALECLLRKIGIDDSEFTTDQGTGRVNLFVGCDAGNGFGSNRFTPELGGASFAPAVSLWSDMNKLMQYDIVMMSCEGSQCEEFKEPYVLNIKGYADFGGRLFLDHLHFFWLADGIFPWPQTAEYVGVGQDLPVQFPVLIDTTFPKGAAFADWLVNVGATPSRGQLTILEGQFSVRNHTQPFTQRWIYTDQNPSDVSGLGVQYMTMNTPAELAMSNPGMQCGRSVYTDLHVTSAGPDFSDQNTPFPTNCLSTEFTPQEQALEFMFFDLSSCVQPEREPPVPPQIVR